MKVLIFSQSGIGGAEVYAKSLCTKLKELGIIALHVTDVSRLGNIIYKVKSFNEEWIVNVHATDPLILLRTTSLLRNARFRIFTNHGLMRAHLLKSFLELKVRDINMYLSPDGLLKTIGWHIYTLPILSYVLHGYDYAITTSSVDVPLLRTISFRKPVSVVWGGARDIFFDTSRLRTARDRYNLLYVGKFEPTKGILQLLKAFYMLKATSQKLRLIIVARGKPLYERLCLRLIKRLGLRDMVAIFKGLSLLDLALLYRYSDLFVFPSYCESMPLSVIEAVANGLPIVTTAAGDLDDLIRFSRAGVLIPCSKSFNDPSTIASAIESILGEHKSLTYYSANALSYAEKFLRWDSVARRHLAIFEQL